MPTQSVEDGIPTEDRGNEIVQPSNMRWCQREVSKIARNSISVCLLATALVALSLAPLANRSEIWLIALMYFKFGLLVSATFLARFGGRRNSAWWFGFAAFGWASVLFYSPGLWNYVEDMFVPCGSYDIDLKDLSGSIGNLIADATGRSSYESGRKVIFVVQFWVTILTAFAGGLIALTSDRYSSTRNNQDSQVSSNRSISR